MKIAGILLNREIRTGGHKRYLELISGLASRGHDVLLLKNKELEISGENLRFLQLHRSAKKPWYSYSLGYVLEIFRARKEILASAADSDFVVAFGETNFPAAFVLKILTGAKILFAFRTSVFEDFSADPWGGRLVRMAVRLFYRIREGFIGRNAAFLVFQSENDRAGFISRNASRLAEKTRVIRNNINASWIDPRFADKNTSKGLVSILFLGSFNERKGVMVLLEAFHMVRGQGMNSCRLFLAGFGIYEERIRNFIAEKGLEETVTVVGRTNDPFELLREKDLLVVPSLFDSYPNVVLEALHTGTPVIGSRVGGIPDILRHEDLLFEPGNPAAIAEKIHKYAADPEEYARIRRLCAERKKDFQFDWIGEFEKIMAPELNR